MLTVALAMTVGFWIGAFAITSTSRVGEIVGFTIVIATACLFSLAIVRGAQALLAP